MTEKIMEWEKGQMVKVSGKIRRNTDMFSFMSPVIILDHCEFVPQPK